MISSFKLNLSNVESHIFQYINILRKVDYPSLIKKGKMYREEMCNTSSYMAPKGSDSQFPQSIKSSQRDEMTNRMALVAENQFRTIQYCAFIHPKTFNKFGFIPNWYDEEAVVNHYVLKGKPIYDKEGIQNLGKYVNNQESFIEKVKRAPKDLSGLVGQESCERYEMFMTLMKKQSGIKLSPPLDVDVMWHAHMLNHDAYVKATKEYFGHIIDHEDGQSQNDLDKQQQITKELWNKEYGSLSNKGLSYNDNTSLALLGGGAYLAVEAAHLARTDSGSSCGSCGSGGGDGGCGGGCGGCGS